MQRGCGLGESGLLSAIRLSIGVFHVVASVGWRLDVGCRAVGDSYHNGIDWIHTHFG